jgi:hypothetical protein
VYDSDSWIFGFSVDLLWVDSDPELGPLYVIYVEVYNNSGMTINFDSPLLSGSLDPNDGDIWADGNNEMPISAFIQALGSVSVTYDVGSEDEWTEYYPCAYWYL